MKKNYYNIHSRQNKQNRIFALKKIFMEVFVLYYSKEKILGVISNKYMFTTLSYATTFLIIDDADHPEVIL